MSSDSAPHGPAGLTREGLANAALARFIEARLEPLVQRWLAAVEGGQAPAASVELADHIPALLRNVIAGLRAPGRRPETSPLEGASPAHEPSARTLRPGFRLESVVREYGLLLHAVLDLVEEAGASIAIRELRSLGDLVSNAVAEATVEFGRRLREADSRSGAGEPLETLLSEVEEARQTAEQQRNHLSVLFEQAPVAITVLKGPRHIVELANPGVCRIWGRTQAELLQRPLFEALPEVAGQGLEELLRGVLASGVPVVGRELLVRVARAEGGGLEDVYFDFVYQPMHEPDGSVENILVVANDVTGNVLARRNAEAASVELQKRYDFERYLAGIVSHDLRTPLQVILMSSTQLVQMDELGERASHIARRIYSSAERAARMIHDLLDFTQARLGGGLRLIPRATELSAVAKSALTELEAAFPDRDVELICEGETRGTWDPDRLAQVVSNLAVNALTYSPAGTRVSLRVVGREGFVDLAVHNHGPPIPPELLDAIFEPLRRGSLQTDRTAGSLGLGLYIVESIVRAHKGSVAVVSTAQEGTTFTVRLPVR